MRAKTKVIITCAITGSIHTPSMSPYLPVTPEQIADQAVGAADGALVFAERVDRHDPQCLDQPQRGERQQGGGGELETLSARLGFSLAIGQQGELARLRARLAIE